MEKSPLIIAESLKEAFKAFYSTHRSNTSINKWQRNEPVAILFFIDEFIRKIISNIFVFIPVALLVYKQIVGNPTVFVPVSFIVFTTILALLTIKYIFFQFRLNHGNLEIRSGVFSKTHNSVPFKRIQNIKITQPLYYRLFDYSFIQFDVAGSCGKQEAQIIAIKSSVAKRIKKHVLATNKSSIDKNMTLEKEEVLNNRTLLDLLIHGISNNKALIVIGSLVPFFDYIMGEIIISLEHAGINIEQTFVTSELTLWQLTLWSLAISSIVLIALTIISICISIITYYNFAFCKQGESYTRRSGLFTKNEVTIAKSRVQLIQLKQGVLDFLFHRFNLKLKQNKTMEMFNNKITIPSITLDQSQRLTNDIYPDSSLLDHNYQPVSNRYIWKNFTYVLLPLYLIISFLSIAMDRTDLVVGINWTLILCSVLVILRWARWGYKVDEKYIYIKKGLFGVKYYCFPIFKVQQTRFKQTRSQRKYNLCSLAITLASGNVDIPYINKKTGYSMINNILYKVEEKNISWM